MLCTCASEWQQLCDDVLQGPRLWSLKEAFYEFRLRHGCGHSNMLHWIRTLWHQYITARTHVASPLLFLIHSFLTCSLHHCASSATSTLHTCDPSGQCSPECEETCLRQGHDGIPYLSVHLQNEVNRFLSLSESEIDNAIHAQLPDIVQSPMTNVLSEFQIHV